MIRDCWEDLVDKNEFEKNVKETIKNYKPTELTEEQKIIAKKRKNDKIKNQNLKTKN